MARGGKRSGAGRKARTPNKASQKRQQEIAESGPTPLDAIIKKMRFHLSIFDMETAKGDEADGKALSAALDKAVEAARDAAPYVHPRLASIQHAGEGGGPMKHAVEVTFVRAKEG